MVCRLGLRTGISQPASLRDLRVSWTVRSLALVAAAISWTVRSQPSGRSARMATRRRMDAAVEGRLWATMT